MNKHFLSSFRFGKRHAMTLCYDILFWIPYLLLFYGYYQLIQYKTTTFAGGIAISEIQGLLASGDEAFVQSVLAELHWLLVIALGGFILIITAGILWSAWTRQRLWKNLVHHQVRYKKWIGAVCMKTCFAIIMFLIYVLFATMVRHVIVMSIIAITLLVILLVATYLFYYHVALHGQVFQAAAKTWDEFPKKSVRNMYAIIIYMLMQVLLFPFAKSLSMHPEINTGIQLIILLLFVTWLRLYTVK